MLPAASAEEGRNGDAAAPEQGRTQLRPPTPRQLARWKAIQQAQLEELSLRATARLLAISRVTVSSYVRANGVPGRRNAAAAPSNGLGETDKIAVRRHALDGERRLELLRHEREGVRLQGVPLGHEDDLHRLRLADAPGPA